MSPFGYENKTEKQIIPHKEELFQSVIEESPNLICRFLPDGVITYANRAFCGYFRLTGEEATGKSFFNLIPPEKGEEFNEQLADISPSEPVDSYEHIIITEEGAEHWLCWTVTAVFDAGGQVKEYHAVGEDTTQNIQMIRALVDSESRYRYLAENARDIIILFQVRPALNFDYISPAVTKLLGYKPKDFYDNPEKFLTIIAPDDLNKINNNLLSEKNHDELLTLNCMHKRGHTVWIEFLSTPIFSKENIITGFLGVGRDVTERVNHLNTIQNNESRIRYLSGRILEAYEEERTRLARELHDDVGQALLTMKLDVKLLFERLSEDDIIRDKWYHDKMMRLINTVEDTVTSIRRCVHDLRPFPIGEVNIEEVLWEMAGELKTRTGIDTEIECLGVEKSLSADVQTVLYRSVQEALTNVARHSGADKVRISIKQHKEAILLEIQDDGIGFDADQGDDKKKKFGLRGMWERVMILNGTVHINSSYGQGTTISITIPVK